MIGGWTEEFLRSAGLDQPDLVAAIRHATSLVHPGGITYFYEVDFKESAAANRPAWAGNRT